MLSSRIKYLLAASALVATSLTAVSFMDDAIKLRGENLTQLACGDMYFGSTRYGSSGGTSVDKISQNGAIKVVSSIAESTNTYMGDLGSGNAMRIGTASNPGSITFNFTDAYIVTKIRVYAFVFGSATTNNNLYVQTDAMDSAAKLEINSKTAPTTLADETDSVEGLYIVTGTDGSGYEASSSLTLSGETGNNHQISVCKILFTLQVTDEQLAAATVEEGEEETFAWTDSTIEASYQTALESERSALAEPSYYANIDFTGTKLSVRNALESTIYTESFPKSQYDKLDVIYRSTDGMGTDDSGNTIVRDYYAGTNVSETTVPGLWGSGSVSSVGMGYNREHVVCQSYFGSSMPMYSDIHHLLPADAYANQRRGNTTFGEVDKEKATYRFPETGGDVVSYIGPSIRKGYTGKVFEPPAQYKGDIARIHFYFVTAYASKMSLSNGWKHYEMFSYAMDLRLSSYATEMLLEWAENDPIDDIERKRNEAIYAVQGNRNPYVDFPSLGAAIFG